MNYLNKQRKLQGGTIITILDVKLKQNHLKMSLRILHILVFVGIVITLLSRVAEATTKAEGSPGNKMKLLL